MSKIYPVYVVYDDNDRKGIILKIDVYHQTGNCTDISTHFKIVVINDEDNVRLQCAIWNKEGNCYISDLGEKWYIEKEI